MITKSGFLVQKNIQSSHKFKVSSSRLQYRDQASRQWIIFPLFYEFAKYVFSTSAMVKIFFLGSAVQWTVFIDTFCLPYSLCRLPSSALMRKWPGSHNAVVRWHELRTPNQAFFSLKSQTFWLGQTILADTFLGIWGVFAQFISTHFGTMSPLSMCSNNQPLFLQKNGLGLKFVPKNN